MKDLYRKNIIDLALTKLDKKYVWGAVGDEEFDCSGFTYYVFYELSWLIPHKLKTKRVLSCGCLYRESRKDCLSYRKDLIMKMDLWIY